MVLTDYNKENNIDVVSVAMSTYNGESYIKRQIKTIMDQLDVFTNIHVRDDGSTDNTIKIIHKLEEEYPGRISVDEGENIGYQRSFMKALSDCRSADYYAFADQDDIWLPDKCIRAIKKVESACRAELYASSVTLVDENETIIGENNIGSMTNGIECYFARQRLAGCTYLFTNRIRNLALALSEGDFVTYPDHDFIVGACAYAFAGVCLDRDSRILHRRLFNSVTGGSNGIRKRLKVEKNVILHKNKNCRDMAKNILLHSDINKESYEFLRCMSEYDVSFRNRARLIRRKNFRTGFKICDMETAFKVLIGKM